ncbi:MAG: hypothetical protein IH978_10400 [Nitrospinae bacterium]|nr:hypothetical protein [Nitrospinota bacterium]
MVNCGEENANACRLMAGADLKLVGQLTCPDPLTEWKELPNRESLGERLNLSLPTC